MDDRSHKTRLEAACTTSTITGKKYLHLKNSAYKEMDHFISHGFRDDLRPVLLGLLQENPAYRFPVYKLVENHWLMKEEVTRDLVSPTEKHERDVYRHTPGPGLPLAD